MLKIKVEIQLINNDKSLLEIVGKHWHPWSFQLVQMAVQHIEAVITHFRLDNGVTIPTGAGWKSIPWRRV